MRLLIRALPAIIIAVIFFKVLPSQSDSHALQTIGVAAAIGFPVAWYLDRKLRKRK